MQQIKAIIFDLGGVILNIDYNLTRQAFEKLGVSDFDSMYSQVSADELFGKLEKGTIEPESFYNEFRKCTGLNLSNREIINAWNSMLLDFREESLEFLFNLKDQYRVFLLSNTNVIHLEAFFQIYEKGERRIPFEKYFEKAYYSCFMGMRKPDEEIFQFVLRENDLDLSSTLFVDDTLQNVEAAKRMGLHTVFLEKGMGIERLDYSIF